MSHYLADIANTSISKIKLPGYTLATKIKKGKSVNCAIDSSSDMGRYTQIKEIKSVKLSQTGKYVWFDVGADEPIEVLPTDYIKLA